MSKHFDELNSLLSLLQCNFSIIGISETRILKGQEPISDFSIPGYSSVETPAESSAGGVLLYVSNYFAYKPRPYLNQIFNLSKHLESVFVEIIIPKKCNIIIGTVYKHPGMPTQLFNSEFLGPFLHKNSFVKKQIIFLGDFDINLLKADEDHETSSFLDTLSCDIILPQILLPTRITKHSKTLIDNIFSSVTEKSTKSGNLCYSISDHLTQFCIFCTPEPENPKKNEVFRKNWTQFNQETFTQDIIDVNWDQVFNDNNSDPELCFNAFNNKIQGLIDQHLPTTKLTKRQIKTKLKPWITSGILKSIAKRDFYLRKFIKAKKFETKIRFPHFLNRTEL